MTNKSLVPMKAPLSRAFTIVSYLTPDEVKQLVVEARKRRNGERDALLLLLLYQTGLRISEALSLTMTHIHRFEGRPVLKVIGKGRKPRVIACPDQLENQLKAYAYTKKLQPNDQIFPINRQRAWQIIKEVSRMAGFTNKCIYPHLFRHSDAIERLRQTGNPKALQHHLGHSSTLMVMRYLSTLTVEDSVRIQQQVKFDGE